MQRRLPELAAIERLDTEPRPATFNSIFSGGPPPPYRSLTSTDDATSFSESSTSTTNDKRHCSGTNLMSEDNQVGDHNLNACSRLPKKKKNFTSIECVDQPYQPGPLSLPTTATTTSYQKYSYTSKPYTNGFYPTTTSSSSRTSSITGQNSASEFVLMPMYTFNKSGPPPGNHIDVKPKRNRMEELRQCWSTKRTKIFCLLLIGLIIAAIVLPIVLTQALKRKREMFTWLPPLQYRLGPNSPTKVTMSVYDNQVRFDMSGDIPFKRNEYTSVYDFRTRKIILIDSSLKSNGKNLVCFVMDINSTIVPNQDLLEMAAKNSVNRHEQLQGWYEAWNYVPKPYSGDLTNVLSSNISECESARWVELSYTTYDQKGQKCPECYDFCLPNYGVENDSIRGETYLNVVRRACFNLFVPEWRSYSYSNEQNQRDFENYYKNANSISSVNTDGNVAIQNRQDAQNFETKWISLQQVPQRLTNLTHQAVDTFQSTLMGAAQSIFGNNPSSNVNAGNNNGDGFANGNGYMPPYGGLSNGNNQNGMRLTNEQQNWETGRLHGMLGVPQQQLTQNGMPIHQGLPSYQTSNQGSIAPGSEISNAYHMYSSSSSPYNPQNLNGYNGPSNGYIPNAYSVQEQAAGHMGDNTQVRQVTNTYRNGQQYPQTTAYWPVDINKPMNGVNGNGYQNQHNFGIGTNLPQQSYVNIPQREQGSNHGSQRSQNNGQSWATSG